MKIWYQSASAYGYEPVWDDYGHTVQRQAQAALQPGTELHVHGIRVMVRDIENWRGLQYFQNAQIMANMRRAEEEGYDAFVIGCTLDPGLYEGRSLLEMPIVGISEAAFHMATTLGRMGAIVTSSSAFCEVYGEQLVRYGLERRFMPGPYIVEASEEEIATALGRPGSLLDKFVATCERAVKDGASVIVPGPAFLSTLAWRAGLRDIGGAPILDTIALAAATAQMQVSLWRNGLRPSRRIGAFRRPEGGWNHPAFERMAPVFTLPGATSD
ncbi:MAG TPA: aspartate/glutamate racemase family protein [Ramlibacter sp.]|nr:aspartate/glutamate racemase family protein [Ramlibacter sp.]